MPTIEDKETFLSILSQKRVERIASHGDADGICSAYISAVSLRKQKPEVYFPPNFKDTKTNSGLEADLVLDKVPDPSFKGCVIDHHPDHSPTSNYSLWTGSVPASLLALELFKETVPEHLWWKACPGIIGDGRSEKVPPYIWKRFPELLEQVGTIRKWSGKTTAYKNPVWFLLSSPINSACRVGKKNMAFSKLAGAKTPFELIFDPDLRDCKANFKKEVDRVRNENRSIDFGAIGLWVVDSSYSVNGTLAWELNNQDRKTALVLNKHTNHGSIRGVLVDYLKQNMPSRWGIGGHSGFAGFSLPVPPDVEDKNMDSIKRSLINEFIEDIRAVMK